MPIRDCLVFALVWLVYFVVTLNGRDGTAFLGCTALVVVLLNRMELRDIKDQLP